MDTPVERIYRESSDIINHLTQAGEISLALSAGDTLRKALLLAAASYFEYRLTSDVLIFTADSAGENSLISSLVRAKAINRQYHTWFNWDRENANAFFSLFGDRFKSYMIARIAADPTISENISSFIKIGSERNKLTHGDFASFSLSLTSEDIYNHYISALIFVNSVLSHLRDCSAQPVVAE
jgi:hypothetical protein